MEWCISLWLVLASTIVWASQHPYCCRFRPEWMVSVVVLYHPVLAVFKIMIFTFLPLLFVHFRYIKDYDGGILMECKIDPKLPYTDLASMIRRQRQVCCKMLLHIDKNLFSIFLVDLGSNFC